jgi:uncharacterized protein YbcI
VTSTAPKGVGAASESLLDDARLAKIASGLADQFASLYEAKPIDPRAHMAGNMLAVSFQGGLSISDEKHLEGGHYEELRAFRERFLEVVAEQLKSVVASLAGGHVTFFSAVFDPGTRTTNMLFVLDLLPDDASEQREAIRNWSEQVRRNARELRVNHLQTREAHLALRDQMHERVEEHRGNGDGGGDSESG